MDVTRVDNAAYRHAKLSELKPGDVYADGCSSPGELNSDGPVYLVVEDISTGARLSVNLADGIVVKHEKGRKVLPAKAKVTFQLIEA